MNISVVIPTFNRLEQLPGVLAHIFASETGSFENIEVIVVDDGSKIPAREFVDAIIPPEPFELKYIYQENAGPAKARNHGISRASHEIVLLIDDDILVSPGALRKHFEAHQMLPRSVVHGPYPYLPQEVQTPAFVYLNSLLINGSDDLGVEYTKVQVVASGNLSIEKSLFQNGEVYRSDLATPAAEEFEFEHRLNCKDIPIYIVSNAFAWHLQPTTIEDKCLQEFKYGVGAAEVWSKIPEIIHNKHISNFLIQNGSIDWSSDGNGLKLKKIIKSILSTTFLRTFVLSLVKHLERITSAERILFPLYRYLCGINLFAGVRQGLEQFKPDR